MAETDYDLKAKAAPECRIEIKFFGPIISILGRRADELVLREKAKLGEAIGILCRRYGEKFSELAMHDGSLNTGLIIFVNGEHVMDPSMELKPEDRMEFLIASQMPGG